MKLNVVRKSNNDHGGINLRTAILPISMLLILLLFFKLLCCCDCEQNSLTKNKAKSKSAKKSTLTFYLVLCSFLKGCLLQIGVRNSRLLRYVLSYSNIKKNAWVCKLKWTRAALHYYSSFSLIFAVFFIKSWRAYDSIN